MAASSPEEWYRSLPPITRGYLTVAFASTLAVQLQLLSPVYLYLDFGSTFRQLELWRLGTCFCFFGKSGSVVTASHSSRCTCVQGQLASRRFTSSRRSVDAIGG